MNKIFKIKELVIKLSNVVNLTLKLILEEKNYFS